MKNTIDLKGMYAKEYIESQKTQFTIIKEKAMKIIAIWGVIWYLVVLLFGWGIITPQEAKASHTVQNTSIKEQIRTERLEICEKAYKESWINKRFIHDQVPAVRCATYMTLIYAFESDFWQSNMCTTQNNCHGMKWNGYNHPAWFITFENQTQSREWFANRYFKFHYKKDIKTFVYNWSMTDQEDYTTFVKSRYWQVYAEIEYLYMIK